MHHPMHTAFIMLAIGGGLACHSYAAIPYLLHAWFTVARSSAEEQLLEERFGDAYARYKQRSGRFLPRLGNR